MASHNRKYSTLPDIDTAPDIYETPELTDDNSSLPPTTVRSPSDNEDDEDEDGTGVSRSHLRVGEARSRFMPANVDARDVDFSDRLKSKRKSYKTSSRRHRFLEDGTEEIGDLSDDDGAETLTRKIARLKREFEEAKEELGKQKAVGQAPAADIAGQIEDFSSLSQALDDLAKATLTPAPRVASMGAGRDAATAEPASQDTSANMATYTVTYAPTYEQSHALAKAAEFDSRLVLLEKTLGVGSSAIPELDEGGLPRAIIPTLDILQKQISTLSDASTSSLDSISRRMRALTQEAENLEKARRNAKAAQDALASSGAAPGPDSTDAEALEQSAKINALYGTLPTIEKLTPLLPPLLDRLRSLREIHADAATAGETLERMEKRQAEMAGDIKQWKDGLEKVEKAMSEGETSMTSNMKVMEEWVKDLEGKMTRLS